MQTDVVVEPLNAARLLLKLVEREQPLLAILGKQAIDDDNNQTGQMLAALWKRPQASFASKLELVGDKATVTREVDAGLAGENRACPLSSLLTCALNEPPFRSSWNNEG